MYDFHCHTTLSDGELLPTELARRMAVLGYTEIAVTDHADFTNIEAVIRAGHAVKKSAACYGITVYSGVELTHIPPQEIDELAGYAKSLGAEVVLVHGESPIEPVAFGTNLAAVSSNQVNILAHPGFITTEEAKIAAANNVFLEVTSRGGHNRTNGHVVSVGRGAGAKFIVQSDAHTPSDLMTKEARRIVARGAGLTDEEAKSVLSLTAKEVFLK